MNEDRYQKMLWQTEQELDAASTHELAQAEARAVERGEYQAAHFFQRIRTRRNAKENNR